jgi:hypothetical protein
MLFCKVVISLQVDMMLQPKRPTPSVIIHLYLFLATKFMDVGKKTTIPHFSVRNYKFGKVHMFKYLESLVTDKMTLRGEIKNRIGLGNKCYYGLRKHLGSRCISLSTKCLNYSTLVTPGAECWVLTKKGELQLAVFEKKS